MNDEFKIVVKNSDYLTDNEEDQLMKISIAEYPTYADQYRKNKYYSFIKPQMTGLVLLNEKIVGKGKLLWQDVLLYDENVKMFGFGVLIDSDYQGRGLGTKLVKKYIETAKSMKADIIYVSTSNPIMGKILIKLGFVELTTPVEYTNETSGKREQTKDIPYVLEVREGVLEKIEKEKIFYYGQGPI